MTLATRLTGGECLLTVFPAVIIGGVVIPGMRCFREGPPVLDQEDHSPVALPEDASGTRARLVLGTRIGDPSSGKFFPAMMSWDEEETHCGLVITLS